MRISVEEVFETVRMTIEQNFDIRTVTLGVNLKDCIDRNPAAFNKRIYKRISEMGKRLNNCADELEQKYGIPITNRRISVTPVALLIESLAERRDPGARRAVLQQLTNPDTSVRLATIVALGRNGDAMTVPILARALAGSGADTVKVAPCDSGTAMEKAPAPDHEAAERAASNRAAGRRMAGRWR